jgi:hypothetical protein
VENATGRLSTQPELSLTATWQRWQMSIRTPRGVSLPEQFGLDGVAVVPVPGGSAPGAAAPFADQLPSGCPEAGASLARQRVGADPQVAQGERRPSSGPVQERAGVPAAIGAEAGYFQGEAVIADARDGPADDGDTDDLATLRSSQRKLVPDHRRMVPVVLLDEGVGVSQREREEGEPAGYGSRA